MKPSDALVLLTFAAAYDETLLSASEGEQQVRANVWAAFLREIELEHAMAAATMLHERGEKITPAAVKNLVLSTLGSGETQVTIPRALPECQECGTPYRRSYAESLPQGAHCQGCGQVLVLIEAPGVGADGDFRQFTTCIDCGASNQVGKFAFCSCGAPVPGKAEHAKVRLAPEQAKREHLDDPMAVGDVIESWADKARAEIPPPPVGEPESLTREDLVRLRAVARARAERRGKPFDAEAWRGPNGEEVPERSTPVPATGAPLPGE